MRTQQKRCRFGIPQVALSAATLSAILAVQPCAAASQEDVRISSPTRLTGPPTEDDYPAAAMAPDGTLWLVYVEYQRGSPIDMKAVRARSFDSLVPRGNGDRIRLMRFDGSNWSRPLDVTDAGLDVWRPTVAITGRGDVLVAWAQNLGGDWEICCRVFTPTSGKKPSRTDEPPRGLWSRVVRVTRSAGSDFHVVAATDADGKVWLAWQSWRGNNFDILVASVEAGAPLRQESITIHDGLIPKTKANEWSPAIAADGRGRVFVAWDSYDRGNYDVRLQTIGGDGSGRPITVAGSARFEARPSLACDEAGRIWIAYEEGDEQWGKDFTIPASWGRNRGEVDPGWGLYEHRTVRVKCLQEGQLVQPAAELTGLFGKKPLGRLSLPRLAVDRSGGLWLLFRRHPRPGSIGGGEVWHSYAVHFDGRSWTRAVQLPHSSNLLDNRPALVPSNAGLLAVYSSDERKRTSVRKQSDLFVATLTCDRPTHPPKLLGDRQPQAEMPVVHPKEAEELRRIRDFRLQVGGRTLRLLRGDFHRHTEYTAHRDGDGLLEDSWRYAMDAGRLDWMGNGDHDSGYGIEYFWWQIQKMTELFHHPPTFVAVHSYERSNSFPNGHRNAILPRRGIRPLPRGDLKGTPEQGTPDTKLFYAYLRHFGGMCASHTSGTGMGTDWRDNDPLVEPVVEIFQGCRQVYQSYEHLGAPRAAPVPKKPGRYDVGYVWNALAKGYRLGFQSSSDHFSTHISYAIVLAEDATRQAIIDAFQKRHCYGANDNIILIVQSGQHLMGDVFTTSEKPSFTISVEGTQPIAKLHVIRSNRYVFTTEPRQRVFDLRYTDHEAQPGQSYYYYVRIEQENGALAWASPMWITYQP